VMGVRHAFAHGFGVPPATPGLIIAGQLDDSYVTDATECIRHFAGVTDNLLESELINRHSCATGWN
jgi:hypothetical protein